MILSTPPYLSPGMDSHIWMLNSSENFSLKTTPMIFQPGHASLLFCSLIWDSKIPLKFSIFM